MLPLSCTATQFIAPCSRQETVSMPPCPSVFPKNTFPVDTLCIPFVTEGLQFGMSWRSSSIPSSLRVLCEQRHRSQSLCFRDEGPGTRRTPNPPPRIPPEVHPRVPIASARLTL